MIPDAFAWSRTISRICAEYSGPPLDGTFE
jgi:hypothetical protein